MDKTTRRSALTSSLVFLGGLVGLSKVTTTEARAVAAGGATTLVFFGRGWHSYSHDRRAGELPRKGDRLTFDGELFDRPDGTRVGKLHAAAFSLREPGGGADDAARLELHTFVLDDGTIVGTGASGAGAGTFAVVGGTGRYAGARGTYVARQAHHELGGDGSAEFVLTLLP